MKAVILAAGVGSRLRPLTDETPKGLLPVAGRPMIDRALDAFAQSGIREALVVTGHLADKIESHLARSPLPCRCIYNPRYATANNYYSLLVAERALGGSAFVKVDSDLVFCPDILERVLAQRADLCLALDSGAELGAEQMKVQLDERGAVRAVSKELEPRSCAGESIGLEYVSADFARALFVELRRLDAEQQMDAYYEDAYHRLAVTGAYDIRTTDVSGLRWAEIDDAVDLSAAQMSFGGP
ncbi:MAG: phosphocholine cytidylyltransferase family protein [Deltaproteobacteria bacterium]|nr:phosphocholine cytidylyltransferase family protein [Deltaproteobacteria bacterium]